MAAELSGEGLHGLQPRLHHPRAQAFEPRFGLGPVRAGVVDVYLVKSVFWVRGGDVFLDSPTGRRTPLWQGTAGSSAAGPWTCTSDTSAAPPT